MVKYGIIKSRKKPRHVAVKKYNVSKRGISWNKTSRTSKY